MPTALKPRLRVLHGSEIALGPGKVALLDAIEESGTLAGAAQALEMSYMRVWKLVRTMNACFREPLVETSRGGTGHGKATLTDTGRAVRALYRAMDAACLQAAQPAWEELTSYLAPDRHT
ncbi:MAG TPA: LysR family transcriptional regulator [Thermoanaerobaculia bacterium]|nr:LysR family transcriptional regulator [Thermoanaerobaculia bacterium]